MLSTSKMVLVAVLVGFPLTTALPLPFTHLDGNHISSHVLHFLGSDSPQEAHGVSAQSHGGGSQPVIGEYASTSHGHAIEIEAPSTSALGDLTITIKTKSAKLKLSGHVGGHQLIIDWYGTVLRGTIKESGDISWPNDNVWKKK